MTKCRPYSEKVMAPHSSTLAWKLPWMEEPGRLQSMGSWRVGHDWVTSLSLFTFMHWRRKWQPTPVFLPGESQGRRSLVSCRLWGCTELDTTEATWQQQSSLLPNPADDEQEAELLSECGLGSGSHPGQGCRNLRVKSSEIRAVCRWRKLPGWIWEKNTAKGMERK